MQKRNNFTPYFLIFLVISVLIFIFAKTSFFKPVNSFLQNIFSPVQSLSYGIYSSTVNFTTSSKSKKLEDENTVLRKMLVDQNKLVQDNKALMDQFQAQNPKSTNLVPANVISAPSFIPGVSIPETLILDRGEADGIRVGDGVVYKDNLVGKVIKTTQHISSIMLITSSSISFTAKTMSTQVFGVIKGQGGGALILDNVLLSDSLQKDDLILTKGDVSENGQGLPPDLIVGKITSISKNPSDIFQKAEIQSKVDFIKLNKVFIVTN